MSLSLQTLPLTTVLLQKLLHSVAGSKPLYTKHTLIYKYEKTKTEHSANAQKPLTVRTSPMPTQH